MILLGIARVGWYICSQHKPVIDVTWHLVRDLRICSNCALVRCTSMSVSSWEITGYKKSPIIKSKMYCLCVTINIRYVSSNIWRLKCHSRTKLKKIVIHPKHKATIEKTAIILPTKPVIEKEWKKTLCARWRTNVYPYKPSRIIIINW